jgi:uncharacterized protein (TIGR01777 family)
VIGGGSGFVGRALTARLREGGHDVAWLSRRPDALRDVPAGVPVLPFVPPAVDEEWERAIAEADAVVNLSGYPISNRWTAEAKREIVRSRMDATHALVGAIGRAREAGSGPRVLVSASGIGYYGDRGDEVLTEDSTPGDDWLAGVAVDWEAAALAAGESGVRVAIVRTGISLGDEGALPRLVTPMRLFVGGPLGNGRQWFPWVHLDDLVGLYEHALVTEDASGPLNAAGPEQLRMREFATVLGRVLRRPSWLPVPRFALKIVLGEFADSVVMSQRADSGKATSTGYVFRFERAEDALREILD